MSYILAIDFLEGASAADVAKWLILLSACIGLWLRFESFRREFLGLSEKREVGPQPFEIKKAAEFVAREHHDMIARQHDFRIGQVEGRVGQLETKLEKAVIRLAEKGEERADAIRHHVTEETRKVHARIDDLIAVVSQVKGAQDSAAHSQHRTIL